MTFVPFAFFKWASRLLSDGPSKKCERRFAKKAIRQKKTVKPKVERQIGKIDALSFFPVTGDNRHRLLSFTDF